MPEIELKKFRVHYEGKRPGAWKRQEMVAVIEAQNEADARRVFFQRRSIRHEIKLIEEVG